MVRFGSGHNPVIQMGIKTEAEPARNRFLAQLFQIWVYCLTLKNNVMRDRNQSNQNQQEQTNERNSQQDLGYEQTSSSQQQQQRDRLQDSGRDRSGIGEQSERSSTDKDRLSESESV